MKTYDIEVQRLRSARHDRGLIELGVDVQVQPRPAKDEQAAGSMLSLPVEHARTLLILLNAHQYLVPFILPSVRDDTSLLRIFVTVEGRSPESAMCRSF